MVAKSVFSFFFFFWFGFWFFWEGTVEDGAMKGARVRGSRSILRFCFGLASFGRHSTTTVLVKIAVLVCAKAMALPAPSTLGMGFGEYTT